MSVTSGYSYWGLQRAPFASGLVPVLNYELTTQTEAAARLRYLTGLGLPTGTTGAGEIASRRVGLMLGLPGTGKTLLAHQFAEHCRQQNTTLVSLDGAGLTATDTLWQFASACSLGPRPADTPLRLFRRIVDFAAGAAYRRHGVVCVVDNAAQAGPDIQTQLLRLLRLDPTASWFSLVLIADLQGAHFLSENLLEEVDLRIDLDPWLTDESIGYLQMALFEAGSERPIFDDEALGAIAALAEGIPRRLNRLANQALLSGAAAKVDQITAEAIEATFEELSFSAAR